MSEQDWADKAAREVYQFCVDLIHSGADSPIYEDRYEKIARIIRSSAPDTRLVAAATKLIKAQDESDPRLFVIADKELRAALSETKVVCVHKYTPYDNTWATECGTVIDDNDSDAEWKFCPNCGGVIKIKES